MTDDDLTLALKRDLGELGEVAKAEREKATMRAKSFPARESQTQAMVTGIVEAVKGLLSRSLAPIRAKIDKIEGDVGSMPRIAKAIDDNLRSFAGNDLEIRLTSIERRLSALERR